MTLEVLRADLEQAGVRLAEDGDTLRVFAPQGALSSDLRAAIAAHKSALLAALAGFHPLDPAIITSEAGRRSLDENERRLARLTAQAAAPSATALDRQLVRDWTAIQDAKRAGRQAA